MVIVYNDLAASCVKQMESKDKKNQSRDSWGVTDAWLKLVRIA